MFNYFTAEALGIVLLVEGAAATTFPVALVDLALETLSLAREDDKAAFWAVPIAGFTVRGHLFVTDFSIS